ncbi:MAG TPA: hypothetical protein VFO39_02165 [Candidatus Sulfotelmatobacter sp.]|nr:hypothetical protein [Candidatus Sulfotelmatobacter sp.]
MWQAAGYYDESDDNKKAYSVAGFIGHQLDLVHLHWAWQKKILDKYQLKYFKASELNSGMGEFAKFRDDPTNLEARFSAREKALFDEIKIASIDVILEFDMVIGLGAVVLLPDYYRIAEEYRQAGRTILMPYYFASQVVMVESGFIMHHINSTIDSGRHGLLRPVFDSHEQYGARAKLMFDDFARKNPISSSYLLPPHYESDLEYVVLQAADNLAYECRRLLITQEYDTHIPERTAMKRLKENVYKVYKLHYESLKAILEAQQPDSIPFEADIHNPHELVNKLHYIEHEAAKNRNVETSKGMKGKKSRKGAG